MNQKWQWSLDILVSVREILMFNVCYAFASHISNAMTGYKGGRIVKIKVKDFMTYDDLEIFPKKGLNIIIGLNGSGKSSLMSAICLGLAGRPQFTGKSTQLADFIKHGKQKAIIEIELEDPVENVVICREIEGDKSTWFLNNLQVQDNEVVTAIKKYNIDVGNLCQFLPQEKVSDFSKIDQKQRLEIMIQAIGEPVLHTLFSDLKQMKVDTITQEKELLKLENTKTTQVQANERLRVEVDKHEERIKLQEELETLQVEKKYTEYEQYRYQKTELKKEKKKLKTGITRIRTELKKMESELSTVSSSENEKLVKINEAVAKSAQISDQLSKFQNELSELHEKAHSAKIEYQNRIDEKRNQKEKLADLEKQIRALKSVNENNTATKNEIQQNTVRNSSQYERTREEIRTLDSELESIKLQINQHEYRIRSFQAELSQLRNENNIQMELLKQRCRDTYDAVCWLEQNESSFKSTICRPPFLSVRVQRDEDRKFIENMVGIRDLKTFVCTDKDDVKRLVNILLEEKKLNVNIGLAPSWGIASLQTLDVTPRLRQLGVKGFVNELFTAPEPVMCYLCQLYQMHKTPVCDAHAVNNTESLIKEFRKFYTPDERISGIYSRYGSRNLTVRKDGIVDKHLIQSATNNSNRIQELTACIEEEQQQKENLTSQAKTYENQRSVFERDQEQLRQQKYQLLENIKKIENLEEQLRLKIELYNRKKLDIINEEVEKKKLTLKICAINNTRMKIVSAMNKLGLDFVLLKLQNATDIMYAKILSKKLAALKTEFQEKESSYEVLEQSLNALNLESDEIIRKATELSDYLKAQKSYSSLSQLRPHMAPLEEIEQNIIRIQAQLDLNYEDNESIVQDYQKRQKLILDATKKIERFEDNLRHLRTEMEEKKQQWLPALESHIRTINKKFSQYYKLLKCAGEISLETGDDPDDFAQYGLQVKLKYRDNEPFSVLSPDHHSGGERNVASVIFILSLQELTTVPFRCVDEINQGMDSSNERKMYEFIADDAAKTGSCSQYFLLTPKLLKNLVYHKDVAVHVIFNSRYLNTKLNVKEHLEIAGMN